MKDVRIKEMKLRNFKGIKELDIDFNGVDTNIYGKNEAGKTSVNDAFTWVFFDKDSLGNKNGSDNFNVKTQLPNGDFVHHLEHYVEIKLLINGDEMTFKKLYKEKYTKQRGSTTAMFTGNTTDYFVNDVPRKKKEFDETVNELFDNRIFAILTDPFYFNEKLSWQERKRMLIDMFGDVPNMDVINQNDDLKPLKDIVDTKSIDDYILQLKSQMKSINEELKVIPVKINEAQLAIPNEIETVDEDKLSFVNERIQELENQRTLALSGGAIADKETALINLRNKKLLLQQEIPNTKKLKDELYEMQIQEDSFKRKISREESDIKFKQSQQAENEEKRAKLRQKYVDVNAMQYDESKNICPHCGQTLPLEKIAGFMEEFNIHKSNEIEHINITGKSLKEEFDKRADEIIILQNDVELNQRAINDIQIAIKEKQQEIDNVQNDFKTKQQPKIDAIDEQIVECEREIDLLKNNAGASTSAIDEEICMLKEQRSHIESIKAKQQVAEVQNKRIEELKARDKELSDNYNQKDKMLYLCELFTREKTRMLLENINSHFEICNFKFFSENINGGIEEKCIATAKTKGVNFGGDNNASKYNIGLDIINTFCKYYQTFMPIFIDNCEGVNEFIKTQSQQIKFYVTDSDESLRVENR